MKKTNFLIFIILIGLNTSCIRDLMENFPNPPAPLPIGVPTGVGSPIGEIIELEINSSGGRIELDQGKLLLIFPQGAFAQSTLVQVQMLSQTLPLSIGTSFDLRINGQVPKKPIEIIFTYADDDLEGTGPDFIHLAQQDEKGIWKSTRNLQVNSSTKTIKGQISTGKWSFFASAMIKPGAKTLGLLQSQELEIVGYEYELSLRTDPEYNDLLAPLVPPVRVQPALVREWLIDGQSSGTQPERGHLGFIANDFTLGIYTAPSILPTIPKVMVSAELSLGKGKFLLLSHITLENKNSFEVGPYAYSNAEVFIGKSGDILTINMLAKSNANYVANLAFFIPEFKGEGSYNFSNLVRGGIEIISDSKSFYSIAFNENLEPYFEGNITITESSTNTGKTIKGTMAGILYERKEMNNILTYHPFNFHADFSGTLSN
ncbi:hypothetical protein [Belliella pelovolcani]|uniref:ZU5 domain-containing protein n=1 Tax=Belliella pelovolcani TaxID=529505 RepID=A0A1N7NVF9_9BACT|nr:hypothetical protein [Belliella pelovolcani]SIT02375.1 hypothetical protein SAMN05421761_11210 [Belliella pelovolcani]